MLRSGLLALAIVAASSSSEVAAQGREMSARELLFACTSAPDSNDHPVCLVFMSGFQAGAAATLTEKPWCPPADLTYSDIVAAFVRQMKAYPQLLDERLPIAIGAALVNAYPCGAKKVAPRASDAPARLAEFKIRPGSLFAGLMQIDFAGKVSNNVSARLKARICVRLYDANRFEIEKGSGVEVNLGLGQSDVSTGNIRIEPRLWPQVVSIKAYAARYGCADSPSEALSQVIETRPGSR